MSAVRQSFQLFIDNELSDDVNSARLVDAAKTGLSQAISAGKASPNYSTIVDGNQTETLTNAKHTINFTFAYGVEAVSFALGFLAARSPHITGSFARSFWVSVDGTFYPPNTLDPKSIKKFAEIIIGNTKPYNRKVDVQLTGTRKLQFSVPAGLYDDCSRAVKQQFSRLVNVKRIYDYTFPGRYTQKNAGYRFQSPAIVITPYS